MNQSKAQKSRNTEMDNFQRTELQKEIVIQRLKERGCRMTKQRKILLDVILTEDCACCKEIYYKASSLDAGIGAATVYRMVNLLEDIGAIDRRNMYRISCCQDCTVPMVNDCSLQQTNIRTNEDRLSER